MILRATGRLLLIAATLACANLRAADLADAVRPLEDGVPQVAVVRLRALLAEKLPDAERRAALLKLGEALVAAEQAGEALEVLGARELRDTREATFFHAQAFAALGRWAEALPLYQRAAADAASPFRADATFGQAESFRALGRIDDAIATYRLVERDPRWAARAQLRAVELLVDKQDHTAAERLLQDVEPKALSQRKERRLMRGRVEAKRDRDRAAELYASVLRSPEGAPRGVLVASLFAIAEVHLQSRTPDAGDNFLEEFIERHPTDPELPAIFAKLDQLYAAQPKPSRRELSRWSNDAAQPRRALAQWYLARAYLRLDRGESALQTFEQLRAAHPRVPELASAFLEEAQLRAQHRDFDRALSALDAARALSPSAPLRERIDLAAGATQIAAGRFEAAAEKFRQLAATSSDAGLFNASLAWLQAGDQPRFAAAKQELNERGATAETRGELLLEQGLTEAARKSPEAAKSLQGFLRDFAQHPRAAEALVALAELAFHAAPPRLDEARQHLARAAGAQPNPTARERADYLMIWIEDAGGGSNEPKVIALANGFLEKHSASSLLPEVRLKLAETFYRRQDFASAQTQFEILAQRNPNSAVAEKALFFAAQSAAQTMGAESLARALVLFGDVVKKNGEWKWAARNEQAAIERKLAKPRDALTLYDEVMAGDARPAEKREALCGKADVLYELGASDRENYRRAIAFYDQLAGEPDAPPHWRNQALFKKGICLEKLEQPAEALATFYRIIDDEARPGKQREYFWFYKAGFNAARLLEDAAKWQPAAAVYEKLAFAGGGRSDEAKARLNRLRLEHFLWEQ